MMGKRKSSLPADEGKRKGINDMTPASLEGQTLGKYRVLEPLGRGGMARVYRAYHPQLDRYVAIKVLRSDLVEDEEFLARFRREARAVAALRHPDIVQVFDSDVQDGVYYIVLELLEGDTLKTRLNDYRIRGEKMPPGEMMRVMLDVLAGLAYAHSEGMIHRDIKPANILLTRRGEAVVTDFGIAQMVGSTRHTASGALMGTLNYMAPEQGLEGQSDARSDIYSLGIVLYEMLTDRTPFEADTPLAILMKHLNDPLPLPRQIDPAIPKPFERVVLKALAKRPEDRYQSAGEMAEALRQATEEAGIELPERISLPLSFTTAEAPAESVAVFSGTAREKIIDVEFAADDTDETLGQRLVAEGQEGGRVLLTSGKELLGAVGALANVVADKTARALREAAQKAQAEGEPDEAESDLEAVSADVSSEAMVEAQLAGEVAGPQLIAEEAVGKGARRAADRAAKRARKREERAQRKEERGKVGRAILGAIMLVVVGNLCMLTIAAPMEHWEMFELGWPIEIFLLSWALCVIMYVASSIWMLIPVGSILGTGVLLAYSELTGNWDHWDFLWIFQIWIVVGSIMIPIWLSKPRSFARWLSRLLGLVLSLVSIALIVTVSLVIGLDSLLASLNILVLP
jgi:serine/threonine protein kinase